MRVLLMRHGEAIDARTAGSDHDRWLTAQGRKTVTGVGKTLSELGLEFGRVYTSPLVRAVQTAEILAATQSRFWGPLEVHLPLSTERGTTAQALAPLDRAEPDELIVLVGHEPKISNLARYLTQNAQVPPFHTSSSCLLQIDAGRGRLQWLLHPHTLELIRG
jgi:phosphohistidine phosphatase